ncbi:MFS transporter [Herbiconiux sp. P15]|uniref:MFS transporter n=1 Tax=Herbiconiux liukaitaii TaxID=3342799 RepID=UPI0035B7AA41
MTFVVRPLGSWLFGRLADTRGRQRALVAAVTMMSAGSVVLALAPTERAVGAWAVVILVVVGILQGIAAGGEYAAATVLLSESGTQRHRGFFASFQATTIVGGRSAATRRTERSSLAWRLSSAVCSMAAEAGLQFSQRDAIGSAQRRSPKGTARSPV